MGDSDTDAGGGDGRSGIDGAGEDRRRKARDPRSRNMIGRAEVLDMIGAAIVRDSPLETVDGRELMCRAIGMLRQFNCIDEDALDALAADLREGRVVL